MKAQNKKAAVIGAGIAGLTAADELARCGIPVTVFEKSISPGGHAARLSCKAVDGCVQCGACLAQERLQRIARQDRITLKTGTRIVAVKPADGFELAYEIDAVTAAQADPGTLNVDALLLTTGFATYDPTEKPYGYGKFANVTTTVEAEQILRTQGRMLRPLDGVPPGRIAFIQCVGSRDSRIGHNWCSKICCPSALRMARLIQSRQPDTAVTFFYIDVQSFGRNFQAYYQQCRQSIQAIRAIPGDIFKTPDDCLKVTYFDPTRMKSTHAVFDMVVLSVGLVPSPEHAAWSAMLGQPLAPSGFFDGAGRAASRPGLFTAGAALGPMSIAESIDSAGKAACEMVRFLGGGTLM